MDIARHTLKAAEKRETHTKMQREIQGQREAGKESEEEEEEREVRWGSAV